MESKFRTYEYAIRFAKECRQLKLPDDLQDQLNRASSSIALNLNEGSARFTVRDRHHFYRLALGSFRECEAIFDISEPNNLPLKDLTNTLGRSLNKLCISTRAAIPKS